MVPIAHYGSGSSVQLEESLDGILSECGRPRGKPLVDCSRGVRDALAAPLGYPPPADFTTEDDHIVLAVGAPLPHGDEIVAAVVQTLTDCGVDPGGITVLQATGRHKDDVCRLIPADIRRSIRSVCHEPSDREAMAYLATTKSGHPVIFNRLLTDADLVIPIGCVRDAEASGFFGINSPFFPAFSDKTTQLRYRALDANENHKSQLTEEADEVGWLLGVSFSIQAIPGGGGEVLHIVAGEIGSVRDRARQLFSEAWRQTVPAPSKLVVATLEGGREQQTWDNLGRAVANAAALAEDGGAIAVLCELAQKPGPAVRHLAHARSCGESLREIRNSEPEDTLPAAQLAAVLDRNHIYLMSKLDAAFVEEMGITPIAAPEELNRLIARIANNGENCILLSNAAHAKVTVGTTNEN